MNATPQISAAGPLAGLSVVELGDGTSGPYAAKLLGDFGAEVVKVEGPNGDSSRRRGPFPDGRPDPEASGLFLYLNINKRGVVLDIESKDGRAALDRLLGSADIFITNLPIVRLQAAGVAPEELRARYPKLIVTTITPFGTKGPWANRHGDELVTYAMAGMAYGTPGMPDAANDLVREPPLHPDCFVAETVAGLCAGLASLTAVLGRAKTEQGCYLDVSQQAAVASMQHRDVTTHSYWGGTFNRLLNPTTIGRMPNFYLPCRDGYVTIPAPMEIHWQRLVEAMGNPEWASTPKFATSPARTENWIELRMRLIDWTMTLLGEELYGLANQTQLPIFQFYPVRALVQTDQVRARNSVVEIEIGDRRAKMPGAPFAMQATPWTLRRPAPRLGEHNAMLRGERVEALP
jgi:crotonobetainyl-CoA:carnitine CoA-transferase CaiB-like acyl-CoA transferase